jgi:hypothetical protein
LDYCDSLRQELIASVKERFKYLANDDIFTFAAILDPNYGLSWLDEADRPGWISKLEKALLDIEKEPSRISLSTASGAEPNNTVSPDKWLFMYPENKDTAGVRAKIELYLLHAENARSKFASDLKKFQEVQRDKAQASSREFKPTNKYSARLDCCAFWRGMPSDLLSLAKLAKKLLAIPATTAAVERVFSKTGFTMRKHRNKIGDICAQDLFFLKCNKALLIDYGFFDKT